MTYYSVNPTLLWRTLEYILPGCGVPRTLEYATTKAECSLESKSRLESVATPLPALSLTTLLCRKTVAAGSRELAF